MRTEQEWRALADETIARSKREILADIAAGRVPMTVQSFGDLHDYVDANEYGGLCEDGWTEDTDDGMTETSMRWASFVQDAVDFWLRTHREEIKGAR